MTPEEGEDPAVKAEEAIALKHGDDDDVFTEPRSPAQRLIAKEKAKFQRITSRKTLKRSPTRTTRKTLDEQVSPPSTIVRVLAVVCAKDTKIRIHSWLV